MNNLDENNDGHISIEEFADDYIEIVKKLRMRQIECEDKMLESYEQYKHVHSLSKQHTSDIKIKTGLEKMVASQIPKKH